MSPDAGGPTAATSSGVAVVGLAVPGAREREAEHLGQAIATELLDAGVEIGWVCSHRTVTDRGAGVTLTLAAPVAPDVLRESVRAAAAARGADHRGPDDLARVQLAEAAFDRRIEGRAVVFPGQADIGEQVTVGALLAGSAIDVLRGLAGTATPPDATVQTRSYLRPRFRDGALCLDVQPAWGNVLVPFETPDPTPCCVDHA